MKIVKKIINRMKIRNQLVITYLSIVCVTVLVVGGYLTNKMNNIVIEHALQEGRNNNETIKSRLEEVLMLAVNTSDMIYQDDKLHALVTKQYENYNDVVTAYREYNILNNYLKYYSDFVNINLYVDNESLLDGSNIVKVTDEVKESQWYNNAIEDQGIITWFFQKDAITGKDRLSLVRSINSDTIGHIGVLVININPSSLEKITEHERYGASILLDGNVIYSNNSPINENFDLGQNNVEASYYFDKYEEFNENGDYLILNTFKLDKSFNNTFQVLVHIPVDIITIESQLVIDNSILMIGVAIILSLLVILYFSQNFSERIKGLRNEMHKVVCGNFNIKPNIDGNDEISEIYEDLYLMMESINRLINEVYVQQIKEEKLLVKQKEAEFKMLASQINPHFLYNTLETIRMRAFCKGDRELASIVKKLGLIMRRNLEVSGEVVSLAKELELIKSYLEIQELRFQDKVSHEFDVQVEATQYQILPLLLQPIVENAFVHGLEGIKEKGKIKIKAYENAGYLIVEVSDNGCGISAERLAFINKNLCEGTKKDNGHQSIGMSNINERVKIYYGDKYGIHLLSELNVGTTVILVLPAIKGEGK